MNLTPITHIVSHLFGMSREKRLRRLVIVFKAFFDESGKDAKDNKAFLMGGFLGSVDTWLSISDAWEEVLHESPRIEYFKSSEAQSLTGEFDRWRRIEADKKVLSLATAISKFDITGFCATVSHRLFEHRDPKALNVMGTKPYDWGFLSATSGVVQYLDEAYPGDEKVDFVFDACSELPACIEQYNFLKQDPFLRDAMRRSGECSPGDDKEVAALQMADLLSGELSRHIDTLVMSDALNVIRVHNEIMHLPCHPPRQHVDTLRMAKLAKQVHREVVEFLKKTKIGASAFSSSQEIIDQVLELKMREAYFDAEWGRVLLALDSDAEYQAFRKKYLEAHGQEEDHE
jgi:hypothetical protein